MPNTKEQLCDLIEYCDYFIRLFDNFPQVDDTPEGRMKAQVIWLKERAENNDLTLPVDKEMLSTIRYIYTDGTLSFHATSPENAYKEIEVPMQRIISIAKNAKLLFKREYVKYACRYIDKLISLLKNAERKLTTDEDNLIHELEEIKDGLEEGSIIPPLGNPKNIYPSYLAVDRYNPTISDLPDGKFLIKTISAIVFNGVRPDSWIDIRSADEETKELIQSRNI
ncbi:hypothetical protein [Thalassolituus sp.]|uniref:hypothetical protein n=1 Tax=Thalassolituus sp. TaxID=2030822 RepID=UPI0035159603